MKFFLSTTFVWVLMIVLVFGQRPKKAKAKAAPTAPPAQQKPPEIDWGKCPQFIPTESEIGKLTATNDKCLKQHPIPSKLTEKSVIAHTKKMIQCGLKEDKWLDSRGRYLFSKFASDISAKKLPKPIETTLVKQVDLCKKDAEKEFPKKQNFLEMVQLFQGCMNFHTTKACEMKLKE